MRLLAPIDHYRTLQGSPHPGAGWSGGFGAVCAQIYRLFYQFPA